MLWVCACYLQTDIRENEVTCHGCRWLLVSTERGRGRIEGGDDACVVLLRVNINRLLILLLSGLILTDC